MRDSGALSSACTCCHLPDSSNAPVATFQIRAMKFRKIRAPIKIKSALPPPPKTQNTPPPPKTRNFMDMGFSCRKNAFFPGVHKIDAPISGPRIADKNFTDTRIFLRNARKLGYASNGMFMRTRPKTEVRWFCLNRYKTRRTPVKRDRKLGPKEWSTARTRSERDTSLHNLRSSIGKGRSRRFVTRRFAKN